MRFLFQLPDNRLARFDNLLLVVKGGPGVLFGEKVEIGLAANHFRVFDAEQLAERFAQFDKTRVAVLEIDGVRDVRQQDLQKVVGIRPVLLGRNRSAARQSVFVRATPRRREFHRTMLFHGNSLKHSCPQQRHCG